MGIMDVVGEAHRALAEEDSNMWIIGAVLVLFGTVGQNLGNNIVSVAHQAEHAKHDNSEDLKSIMDADDVRNSSDDGGNEQKEETFLQKNLWAIGTIIFVSGSLCNFVSFGYAAQSLLASLQSVQFLSNMVFAKIVHKETLSWTMIGATCIIICGNVLVVVFSEHSAIKYTGQEIFNLWATNTAFHVYLAIMGSIAIVCEYTYRKYTHSRVVEAKLLPYHSFLEPACYCLASSFIGTLAIMNAKCLSMYLTGADPGQEFQQAPLYVALFIWLAFVTFWFRRMDHGLDLFPPLFFIPVLMISFVFINIVCGGIFFLEFAAFSVEQYIGFCCGASLILSGVYFLAPPNTMDVGPQEAEEVTDVRGRTMSTTSMEGKSMKRSRMLSFVSIDSEDVVSVTSDGTKEGSRPRVNTMSHPLAALKEVHRRAGNIPAFANAEKFAANQVEQVHGMSMRSMRRISIAAGISSPDVNSGTQENASPLSYTDSNRADENAGNIGTSLDNAA